jgi:hypothetical protein
MAFGSLDHGTTVPDKRASSLGSAIRATTAG